jgi:hypothetical protein
VTDVRGAAGSTVSSVGSASEAATPLESRMRNDVMSDVRASLRLFR